MLVSENKIIAVIDTLLSSLALLLKHQLGYPYLLLQKQHFLLSYVKTLSVGPAISRSADGR